MYFVTLQQCIQFHAKMAARCWIPTRFWLVNNPGENLSEKFGLCWGDPKKLPHEREQAKHIMNNIVLNQNCNPLASTLRKIEKYIAPAAQNLVKNKKKMIMVISTQGVPSDEEGRTGADVNKNLQRSLVQLLKLPVKVVIRLCTDDEKVQHNIRYWRLVH